LEYQICYRRHHLGNILTTITDRRIGVYDVLMGQFDHYEPEQYDSREYYAFGSESRRGSNPWTVIVDSKQGFNNKEKSHKTNSKTNYDYGFRIYNAGIGRFLSVDPLTSSYPELTPYQFASNTPIQAIDLNGLESWKVIGGGTVNGPYVYAQAAQSAALAGTATVNLDPVEFTGSRSTYEEKLFTRLSGPKVMPMVGALSTVGNRLFGSPYDPYKVLNLTETKKQEIFSQSTDKTIGILFSEFIEGTGCETRCFDDSHPITRDIADSYTTHLFMNWFLPNLNNGSIKEGEERYKTVFTSPDNASSWVESAKAHAKGLGNRAALFTGSLDYYYKVTGHQIAIRVHNELSLSSGITRNKLDDLHRQKGTQNQLGNTSQWFEFTIDLNNFTK
jgi:RHS repeat-associated protein